MSHSVGNVEGSSSHVPLSRSTTPNNGESSTERSNQTQVNAAKVSGSALIAPKPGPGLWRPAPRPVTTGSRPQQVSAFNGGASTSTSVSPAPVVPQIVDLTADRGGVVVAAGASVGDIVTNVSLTPVRIPACLRPHAAVIATLRGHRSALTDWVLPYHAPREDAPWHPQTIWAKATNPFEAGSILLTGHGGIGKTRTLFEVAALASNEGWDVFHMRGSNVSPALDYLKDRTETSSQPVLIVIDYLNLYHATLDLDLLQDLAAAARYPSPKLAVIASVRTGWWNNHTEHPGLKSMDRVQLAPDPQDLYEVCAAVAAETAPTAVQRRGLKYVLGRTGLTRPVLVRLIATIVEDHITSGVATDTLISDDLSDYLRDRLTEDHLLPLAHPKTALLPPTVDETVHATAVVLATTPTTPRQAALTAATVLASVGQDKDSHQAAEHLVNMLATMGWLTPADTAADKLAAVHDVVVDHVVESVLFPSGNGMHPVHLATLLDAASTMPATLTNAFITLERIHDEREARDEINTTLRDCIRHWLDTSGPNILGALIGDPCEGIVTASALLTTPLLSGPEATWDLVTKPLLRELGSHTAAQGLLTIAAQSLPDIYSTQIGEMALTWLAANPPDGTEYLLRHLLDREEMPEGHVDALLELSYAWTEKLSDSPGADYVLSRLLASSLLSPERMTRTIDRALHWLALHGNRAYASHLLSALLLRKDSSAEHSRATINFAATWFEHHGANPDAAFVLSAFLGRPTLESGHLNTAVRLALAHAATCSNVQVSYLLPALLGRTDLSEDQTEGALKAVHAALEREGLEASFVLRSMLRRANLTQQQTQRACEAALASIAGNYGPEASYVLDPLLRRTDLVKEQAEAACVTAQDWLAHNTGIEAWHVLEALLSRPNLTAEQSDAACAAAHVWLNENSGPEASYVLQPLLVRTDLTEWQSQAARESAHRWILGTLHPGSGFGADTSYVIDALLSRTDLSEEQTNAACEVAHIRLNQNTGPQASYLLQALLRASMPLSAKQADAACAAAHAWLDHHPGPEAKHVLQALLEFDNLSEEQIEDVCSVAHAWLANNFTAGANHVLRFLLRRTDLKEEQSKAACGAALAWLDHHPGPEANFVLQALLERDKISEEQNEQMCSIAHVWLADNFTAGANHVLQRLLKRTDLTEEQSKATCAVANAWLDKSAGSGVETQYVQKALLARSELRGEHLDRFLRENGFSLSTSLVRGYLAAEGLSHAQRSGLIDSLIDAVNNHDNSKNASKRKVLVLLGAPNLSPEQLDLVMDTSASWSSRHMEFLQTRYVLRTMLLHADLTVDQAEIAKTLSIKWLDLNAQTSQAWLVLATLLERTDLQPNQTESVWTSADIYLNHHCARDEAANVIRQLLTSSRLTPDQLKRAADAGRKWVQAHTPNATALGTLETDEVPALVEVLEKHLERSQPNIG